MEARVLVYEDKKLVKAFEGKVTDIVVAATTEYVSDKRVLAATLFGMGMYETGEHRLVLAPAELPDGGVYAYKYSPSKGFEQYDVEISAGGYLYLDVDEDPVHELIVMLGGPTVIHGTAHAADTDAVKAAEKVKVTERGFILPDRWAVVPAKHDDELITFWPKQATYTDTLTSALRMANIARPVDYVKAMTIGFGMGDEFAVFAAEPAFGGTFYSSAKLTGYDISRALAHKDWKVIFE